MKPREWDSNEQPEFVETDKSAAISHVKLHTDIQQNCIVASGKEQIDSMTLRNFPEYMAPVRHTGGVFALVYNEFLDNLIFFPDKIKAQKLLLSFFCLETIHNFYF